MDDLIRDRFPSGGVRLGEKMAKDNGEGKGVQRTMIIVALIGLIGTVTAALISANSGRGSERSSNAGSFGETSRGETLTPEPPPRPAIVGRWVPTNGAPGDINFVETGNGLEATGTFVYNGQPSAFIGSAGFDGDNVRWQGTAPSLFGPQPWSCNGRLAPSSDRILGSCTTALGVVDIDVTRTR